MDFIAEGWADDRSAANRADSSFGTGGLGRSSLSRLLESVSAFDEVHQSLYEARCRSAVHHIVVEGDCQVEQLARFDALLDDSRLASDAAYDQRTDCPAGAKPQPPPRPAMPSAVTPTVPAAVTRRVGSRRPTARCVDAVLPPVQVEVVVSVAPCGGRLRPDRRRRSSACFSSPSSRAPKLAVSLVRPICRSNSQAAKVRVGFFLGRLQFELHVEGRHPGSDRGYRIQVEF